MSTELFKFQIASTYIAYFGRPPEFDGLNFWLGRLESGASYAEVARAFAFTPEATGRYPDLADGVLNDPATFIGQVYQNIFERPATAAEIEWWTTYLADKPVGDAIQMIVDGAQGTDRVTLENKAEVALFYTNLAEAADDYRADEGRAIIDGVDQTQASVDAAKAEAQSDTVGVITVPGPVVTVPGPTVEVEPDHIVTFDPNGTLDKTATRNFDGIELPFGSGNTPANWNIALDQTANLELGLKVHYRTGDDVLGTVIEDGVLSYDIAAGVQTAGQGGASQTVLNRSAASFDFSINEGVGELGADNLTYHLWVDTDRTDAESFLKLTFNQGPDGRWYGVDEAGAVVIGDSTILDHQIANSVNFGFGAYASRIDGVGETSGDTPAGEYMVRLFATNAAGVEVVGVTNIINLVDSAA